MQLSSRNSKNDSNMIIPDDSLDDFIDRYERAYGERLSREEARPIATRVLDVYRLITQPLPGGPSPLGQSNPEAI